MPTMSRRKFLRVMATATAATTIPPGLIATYANRVEPNHTVVERITMQPRRLPDAFDGFRILLMGDVHADMAFMDRARLQDLVDLTLAAKPDIVVNVGDYVTDDAEKPADTLIATLSQIGGAVPTYSVMGNHDYWTDQVIVRNVLRRSNFIDLNNRVEKIERNGQFLHLCGLDDVWENMHDLGALRSKLNGNECAILLCHEPDFADTTAATGLFDVQLSGHSHGGQVNLPVLGPPILPHLGTTYHTGRYQVLDMIQYTTRGYGTTWFIVRLNCRPELTLITLRKPTRKT